MKLLFTALRTPAVLLALATGVATTPVTLAQNAPPTASASQPKPGTPPTAPAPPLSTMQLASQPVFTTLDEAMAAPEAVYRLDLSGQKLKEFPLEILFFRNLQELNLSNNKIEVLPPEINTLQNLQVLNLYRNRIVLLPDQIGDLANLRELYLNRNRMMYFPIGIVGLQRLEYLDVSQNLLNLSEIEFLQNRLPNTQLQY